MESELRFSPVFESALKDSKGWWLIEGSCPSAGDRLFVVSQQLQLVVSGTLFAFGAEYNGGWQFFPSRTALVWTFCEPLRKGLFCDT